MKRKYHKIVICDPRLKNQTGHFWETVCCFRDAALEAGYEVEVLGCEQLPEKIAHKENIRRFFQEQHLHPTLLMTWRINLQAIAIAVKRIFGCEIPVGNEILEEKPPSDTSSFGWPERFRNRIRQSYFQKSCRTFRRRLSRYRVTDGTLFFFMTFFEPEIAAAAAWLNEQEKEAAGAFICLGFVPTPYYFRLAIENMGQNSPRHPLVFFAMREPQLAEYRKYGIKRTCLIPMPHAYRKEFDQLASSPDREHLSLSFLGGARLNKGFHWLPKLIEELRTVPGLSPYRFNIQVNYRNVVDSAELKRLQEAGEMLETTDAALFKEELSTQAYQQLLADSDIILLPYPQNARPLHHYQVGTSGILSEAIAAGKVTVVPAGTWMAEMVEKYGSGTIFADETDFVEAVARAIRQYPELKAAAEQARDQWRRSNCPANALHIILSEFT